MITIRFSMLRNALAGALLTLGVLGPAQANPAQPVNSKFPAYPVEAAACGALKAGGPFTVDFDAEKIKNAVSAGAATVVSAFIFPDTPVFRFYAANQRTFFATPYREFDPSMRCITRAAHGPGNLLHFSGLAPGKYLTFERTDEVVTYQGYDVELSGELGPEGILHPIHTYTPVWKQYQRRALLGGELTISESGTVNASELHVLYSEGY